MENMMIVFPYFEELREAVKKLRAELSMLILELDQLRLIECRNIEMAYWLALGSLEYRVYEAQCRFLRLRRKIDLIQAKKNRQEPVVLPDIEETLNREFADYQERLEERMKQVNAALEYSRKEFLSEEDTRELKHLYREIVKALHPDLHPEFGPEQLRLFQNARTAYENGDLPSLRVIMDLVSAPPPMPEQHENVIDWMRREQERLQQSIGTIRAEMERVKSSYPYTLKEFVQDEEKRRARREVIETLLRQYEAGIEQLQERIAYLLEG